MFAALLLLFGPLYCHSEPVQITAYEGDTVTLRAAGNTTWNFSRIRWSIFDNKTFIATLNRRDLRTDLFWSYTGRLTLDNATGDLQINNVVKRDEKLYSVLLMDVSGTQQNHDVQLTVRAQLPEPTLTNKGLESGNGHCEVKLLCTSRQTRLNFTWAYLGNSSVFFKSYPLDSNSSVLWAYLPAGRTANFSCTVSDDLRHTSNSLQVPCRYKRNHGIIVFIFGMFTTPFVLMALKWRTGSQPIAATVTSIYC